MELNSDQSKVLIKKIKEVQFKSVRQCISYSKQLLALSVSACDLYGTAFAYRYLSYCYFCENKIKLCFQISKKALSLAETNNYNDLLPDLYNTLGYIYHIQSLEQLSIEYFLKGLKAAKAVGNLKTSCYIYSNIGVLYDDLKQYKKSLYYINKAYQIITKESVKSQNKIPTLTKIIHNIIDLNLKCKNYVQAEKILKEVENTGIITEPEDISSCFYFHAMIEWKKGNEEHFFDFYNKGILTFDNMPTNIIGLVQALDYIDLSLKTRKLESCQKLFTFALKGAQSVDFPIFWLRYYNMLIRFCQSIGDKEMELYAKENWRVWNKKKKLSEQMQKNFGFEMQEKLKAVQDTYKETKNMHEVLEQASNIDYLTGVNNRRRYLEDIKQSLRQLQKKQEMLGLIYMDIDCFKDYNDCFGHVQGDECIKRVAQTVKESFQNFGTVYRIGGDEFAVILKNRSKIKIKEYMKQLKINIEQLKIPHPLSEVKPYLTVSIGAYVTVPNKSITVADFCKAADHALYQVKRQARNGFYIMEGKSFEKTR